MGTWLDRLGRFAARRHWRVIGTWVLAAVGLALLAGAAGGTTVDVFTIPGAQSQTAIDLLEHRFPAQSGTSATIVFHTAGGTLATPEFEAAIAQSAETIKSLPGVSQVVPPVGPLAAALTSHDGRTAFATVQYSASPEKVGDHGFDALERATAPVRAAGAQVEIGGPLADFTQHSASGDSDLIGLIAAAIILIFAFGSIVAAGLPIGTALLGLAGGLSCVFLLASVTDVGTVAPDLGTMIGLGVGIDYSLFVVTRHRQNLSAGMTMEASIGHAVATAGQAVLFAGTTVVIAICGLVLSGIPYVATLGFTASIIVAIMMLAALTLLPALLGLVGHRIESGRTGRFHLLPRHDHGDAATPKVENRGWARWAETVAKRPWPFAIAAVIVLLTLAAPFASIRYGESDDASAPADSTQRKAFDLLADGFGPGVNGPLAVVVTFPTGHEVPPALLTALKGADGVKQPGGVAPPVLNDPTDPSRADTAVITIIPTSAPDEVATTQLVERLRTSVIPHALADAPGVKAYVGGVTASFIDLGDKISGRLPIFIGAVVMLSFLLLMLVFHSIAIPATAAVMNLLSVGAAYGVTTAVFQWGWGKSLVGLSSTVPIVSFVPMMMFAILFGLSMDYQVFLLTRVREEYDSGGDTRRAVVTGLASTARVITSAALIMITVFLSFVGNPAPEVKMFGLGLAVAVLVDATVVRMVLVPAVMELLGKANWWLPKTLDRVLPRIEIE